MTHQPSLLVDLFNVAVQQALPHNCMKSHLAQIDASKGLCVLGAGKASVQMAQVVEQCFGEKCYGKIVTRHGYTDQKSIGNIQVLSAGHPIPDQHSALAAEAILQEAQNTPADIPVLFLISGGGSALMSMAIAGLSFEQKIEINKFLLASGACIDEINLVRKALSAIKGGKLAQVIKGEHHTLVISDVVGDQAEIIASGPTIAHEIDTRSVMAVMEKYAWPDLAKIETVLSALPTQSNTTNAKDSFVLIANAKQSIDAAAYIAEQKGLNVEIINYEQQGDATEVANEHAKLVFEKVKSGTSCLLLSGGELTVKLNNPNGAGGPNQEYMLALAIALKGQENVYALACDTDGVDGNRDVAGAMISPDTLIRAKALGLDPKSLLQNNLTHDFFDQLNDLVITGPTHTNVNDFRAILITP